MAILKRPVKYLQGGVLGIAALLALVWPLRAQPQGKAPASVRTPGAAVAEPDEEGPAPPPAGPVRILGRVLEQPPATGQGRLSMVLSGNRRWCTWPDDRVVRPPGRKDLKPESGRTSVYTFGYQFTIAAVARSAPQVTLLLFEGPVIRTAILRQAGKMGKPPNSSQAVPRIASETDLRRNAPSLETPMTIVPSWLESFRCAVLGERFEFDLDPGVYDVYMAFDLLNREGGWVHRSSDYLTDVTVEAGQRSLLEGSVNFEAGGQREVALRKSTLLPLSVPSGAGGP